MGRRGKGGRQAGRLAWRHAGEEAGMEACRRKGGREGGREGGKIGGWLGRSGNVMYAVHITYVMHMSTLRLLRLKDQEVQ